MKTSVMEKTFVVIFGLFSICFAMSVNGQVRCNVAGSISDDVVINKLVICRYDEDPKNAQHVLEIHDNKFSCDIESDEIYKYKIIDLGEILEKGNTNRWEEFYVEEDASIDIKIGKNKVVVNSTGKQFQINESMKNLAVELFSSRYVELESLPDSVRISRETMLDDEYNEWILNYYIDYSSLEFLFDLHNRLSYFHLLDRTVKPMLEMYDKCNFSNLNPQHSIHKKISELSHTGLQMTGGEYQDYYAFDLDMREIKVSDFISKGSPTIIIMWATWCSPCRRDALEMIPVYEKYKGSGVNFVGLAREYKSADNIKSVIEKDKHSWPTIMDLDDKYKIFEKHGVTSSGFYLIDGNGIIVKAAYNFNEIEPELQKLLSSR